MRLWIDLAYPYAQKRGRLTHGFAISFWDKMNPTEEELLESKDVTTLLLEWHDGNQRALNELMPLVYGELRRLARRQLRHEPPGNILQTTALVHEAYLKLVDQRRAHFQDREHFFAVASQLIRRILVSDARRWHASKRGAGMSTVVFDESVALSGAKNLDLVTLDDALEDLSKLDPQQGRIVELRFFGGLTLEDTAKVLGISRATVTREWNLARTWLHHQLIRSAAYGA
jgi:RNA polymerase sigma factor (TIGR02999 family)